MFCNVLYSLFFFNQAVSFNENVCPFALQVDDYIYGSQAQFVYTSDSKSIVVNFSQSTFRKVAPESAVRLFANRNSFFTTRIGTPMQAVPTTENITHSNAEFPFPQFQYLTEADFIL